MRITSSTVAMNSERQYSRYAEVKNAELITTTDQAARLEFSEEAGNLLKQLEDGEKQLEQQGKERQERSLAETFRLQNQENRKVQKQEQTVRTPEDLEVEMLRQMLAALRAMQKGRHLGMSAMEPDRFQREYRSATDQGVMGSSNFGMRFSSASEIVVSGSSSTRVSVAGLAGNAEPTQWVKTTVTSAFVSEMEHTAYQAAGVAKTEDGREISFGVTMEMSRAFCAKYESLTQEDYVYTDPLVINLDSTFATVTDQKFLFDLDADGKEEMISFAGEGSGFLALDKNGDGAINDGAELFGTKSGNGFKDLAVYDDDGNGWIDEGDSVFRKLKIWTKDAEGNDKLVNLKAADVGAIYLGYADTEFSLNATETNEKNAVIRNTGVFLKESGGSGTVQHVDLVV